MSQEITKIEVFQVALPLKEGHYKWSDGKSVKVFDSTVVAIHTNTGICGYGEVCPLGPAYLPAYGKGVRAGISEVAPHLIGIDPTALSSVNDCMDRNLRGHPYVKSGIDMACWDILGKVTGLPLFALLGGRYGDSYPLYRAISQASPHEMADNVRAHRADGYRKFQLKVGSNPDDDIARIFSVSEVLQPGDVLVADANTGWSQYQAMRVVDAVRDVNVYIEQPCLSYQECLNVRRNTHKPFILDEIIDSVNMIVQASKDGAMDIINLKISKVGGITKAHQIRDLCVSLGIAVTIEDTWGSDIATAAIAHLAHSTPTNYLFSSTDFNSYVTISTANGSPHRMNGNLAAMDAPGLGIDPLPDVLGVPVLTI